MSYKLAEDLAAEINSSPTYVIFMAHRLGMEITLGRQLTVKEQRKLYGFLKPFTESEKRNADKET